jgi:hypothetical protein
MLYFRLFIGILLTVSCSLSASAIPLASADSAEGQCRAVFSVSPERPFLADTITLTLTVTCPDDNASVEFPSFGEMLGELRIVDIQTTNRQLILTTIPQRAGKTPIWAMMIRCGQEQINLPAVELDIASEIDIENASLDDIGLVADQIPKRIWHIYTIAALLVLTALILLWLLYNRKRIELPEEITHLSAQETALLRLADLLESRKHESDVKDFFVELSDIVRWYVERLTGIRAPELTTEEFLHKIAEPTRRYWQGGEQHTARYTGSLETLVPFLESADIVKFAKHVPTNDEMMLAFRRAENFIRGS